MTRPHCNHLSTFMCGPKSALMCRHTPSIYRRNGVRKAPTYTCPHVFCVPSEKRSRGPPRDVETSIPHDPARPQCSGKPWRTSGWAQRAAGVSSSQHAKVLETEVRCREPDGFHSVRSVRGCQLEMLLLYKAVKRNQANHFHWH